MSSTDKKRIETGLESMRTEWRKRKRMFKDMWDAVTENLPGDRKDLMASVRSLDVGMWLVSWHLTAVLLLISGRDWY